MLAKLKQGRESYRRRAWGDAYRCLSLADQATPLGTGDLELLAMSAYLIGRDDGYLRALERAHQAYLDAGESRARRPVSILAGSASFLSRRDGARVRVVRPCPAVAGTREARMRRAAI